MNKMIFACLLVPGFLVAGAEPVCKKCEMIREYNAAHPENNYFYYDDYKKEKENKLADEPTASADKEKDSKKQK